MFSSVPSLLSSFLINHVAQFAESKSATQMEGPLSPQMNIHIPITSTATPPSPTYTQQFTDASDICKEAMKDSCKDLGRDVCKDAGKESKESGRYLCWKKGCNQYFASEHALQRHFKEIHAQMQCTGWAPGGKSPEACDDGSPEMGWFGTAADLKGSERVATLCRTCSRNFRYIEESFNLPLH